MKKANKKKPAKKRVTPKKKLANKKAAPKNAQMATKAGSKKTTRRETASSLKKRARQKSRGLEAVEFAPEEVRSDWRPGELSGDLQGLSTVEDADSESVAELLEEGNAFEADVVKGVEDAPNADEGPVRTHEVPEDDVPDEVIPDEYKHKE
jgi:hypothetical protein